jgi:phosphoserine phosphatase RsbU/P
VTKQADAFYAALLEDDPQELYDAAPCAYLSTLPDGTIIKFNTTFLTWTGYRADDLIGRRRLQDLLAHGERIFYETHIAPALHMQGAVREIAVEVTGPSGARLPVLLNAVLKRDSVGDPRVIRIAFMDATERRAYEHELMLARRRAEESEARARALAQTLQTTLLPPRIVQVSGLDIGGAYHPAGDGSQVGGDFYDVFETGRGSCGVMLGDVCGKGPAAAVLTAFVRYTLKAEALHHSEPSAVFAAVNDALLHYHPGQLCSAVFMMLEAGADRAVRLRLAIAGHPFPLRLSVDGRREPLGHPGILLGLRSEPGWRNASATLHPGEAVVLYTDGVTEARRGVEFFGPERLEQVLPSLTHGPAQEAAERIATVAVDFQDGYARDDIAVVVVKAMGAPSDG